VNIINGAKNKIHLIIYLFEVTMSADDFVSTTIEELQRVLLATNIVGDPIEMEDKIVLPVSKVGLGFGSGSKKGSENKKAGNSEVAGGGIGILPVAVVIVFKGVEGPEGIKVVPLAIPGAPSTLLESLEEISSAFMDGFEEKEGSAKKKSHDKNGIAFEVK
jgi:uncharacterized spore protein YtfJ